MTIPATLMHAVQDSKIYRTWLIYGLLIGNWPIAVANTVTLFFSGSVLLLKLRHG